MSERNVKNANVIINQAVERGQAAGIYSLEEVKNIIGALEILGSFLNESFAAKLPNLPDAIQERPRMEVLKENGEDNGAQVPPSESGE